jgi:DNA topoisomerase-1
MSGTLPADAPRAGAEIVKPRSRNPRLGIACPEAGCTGEFAQRVSGEGKTFYGCTNYPACRFTTRFRPVAVACPLCGQPYLELRKYRSREVLTCPFPACRHKQPYRGEA